MTTAVISESQLLASAGLALFGEHWKNPLARALGVNRDTLDDWHLHRLAVPAGVWVDIGRLLASRHQDIGAALQTFSDHAPPGAVGRRPRQRGRNSEAMAPPSDRPAGQSPKRPR
jgi:hypothetical protein